MSLLRGPIDVVRSRGLTIITSQDGRNFQPRAGALDLDSRHRGVGTCHLACTGGRCQSRS